MHALFRAATLALMLAVAGLVTASDATATHRVSVWKHPHAPSPVTLRVDVGYGGQYRRTAWTPIRVAVHNRTGSSIAGMVDVPDKGGSNMGPPASFHTAYQAPLVLPGHATKRVTLYMPGYDDPSSLEVSFRAGGRSLKTVSPAEYPSPFDSQQITVGALSADPQNSRWLTAFSAQAGSVTLTRLTTATVDPIPEALSTFDVIVLTNVDASRLRDDQVRALQEYARNGGGVVLVGGPDWQETLRPLTSLVPGTLSETRTVSGLPSLVSLIGSAPPAKPTTISVLRHPSGFVLAAQDDVPLVVRQTLGKGQILYLAFDPQVEPLAHWRGARALVTRLITTASPAAMGRPNLPNGFQPQGPFFGCCNGPWDISSELSNVPAASLPSLILFVILTLLYVILLGPVNFLALRRLRRREWSWVTIPVLAAICMATTYAVAFHLKGNTVLVNSVGTIDLEGDHGPYPATLYAGLFAPVRGDYHLTFDRPALPAALSTPYFYYGPGMQNTGNPLNLTFQEGSLTRVNFPSMNMWSMRDVSLRTSADVSGALRANLTLDRRGALVGTVHNGTDLDLVHPAVIAGQAVLHLADLPAGATARVHLIPKASVFDNRPMWMRVYGQPFQRYWGGPYYGPGGVGGSSIPFIGSSDGCCSGPPPPRENSFKDRIRNVAAMLPETQASTAAGEVVLLAWTQRSLGTLSVDGSVPQRRDLTLVMSPLSVHLPGGAFTLPVGVVGAQLVDASPGVATGSGCCPFDPRTQPLYLASGGVSTFQFTIPGHGVHFKRLTLDVNAGGAQGENLGQVYNWKTGHWENIDLTAGEETLRHPDSDVSPNGTVLVRLKATDDSGAIVIGDARQQLQLSGAGTST